MNQTELEKTELEIAKLKLAQEKHKLEQMQKRQKVVDGLGQGAAAVGGAAKSGVQWVLTRAIIFTIWVVALFVIGMAATAIAAVWKSQGAVDFDWWYSTYMRRHMWVAGVAGVFCGVFMNKGVDDKALEGRFQVALIGVVAAVMFVELFTPISSEVITKADRESYSMELGRLERAIPRLNPDDASFDVALVERVSTRMKSSEERSIRKRLRAAVEAEVGPIPR